MSSMRSGAELSHFLRIFPTFSFQRQRRLGSIIDLFGLINNNKFSLGHSKQLHIEIEWHLQVKPTLAEENFNISLRICRVC